MSDFNSAMFYKFVCPVIDCSRHVIGFDSLKEKKQHMTHSHPRPAKKKVRRAHR